MWATLEQHGWLAEQRVEVRRALRSIARAREFEGGQYLYYAGDPPNGVFGLFSGALDISFPRSDGHDLRVHRADAGFWIGDSAVLAEQIRLVSVRAVEPSRVVHLPQRELSRLIGSMPEIVTDFYALSHHNMEMALTLLANLSVSPSAVRVAMRLLLHDEGLSEGEQWIRISQEYLSELVAVSIPTVQRALRRLEKSGLIEVGYRRLRVLDRPGLLQVCDDVTLVAPIEE